MKKFFAIAFIATAMVACNSKADKKVEEVKDTANKMIDAAVDTAVKKMDAAVDTAAKKMEEAKPKM